MGMFDELWFKYPFPEPRLQRCEFQTKTFREPNCDVFTVQQNGLLTVDVSLWWPHHDGELLLDEAGRQYQVQRRYPRYPVLVTGWVSLWAIITHKEEGTGIAHRWAVRFRDGWIEPGSFLSWDDSVAANEWEEQNHTYDAIALPFRQEVSSDE